MTLELVQNVSIWIDQVATADRSTPKMDSHAQSAQKELGPIHKTPNACQSAATQEPKCLTTKVSAQDVFQSKDQPAPADKCTLQMDSHAWIAQEVKLQA